MTEIAGKNMSTNLFTFALCRTLGHDNIVQVCRIAWRRRATGSDEHEQDEWRHAESPHDVDVDMSEDAVGAWCAPQTPATRATDAGWLIQMRLPDARSSAAPVPRQSAPSAGQLAPLIALRCSRSKISLNYLNIDSNLKRSQTDIHVFNH